MRVFFIDFLKTIADSVLVIAMIFISFLLVINIYHYKEVSYKYEVNVNDSEKYQSYHDKLTVVDKKMKSVDITDPSYATTAKPIYHYYEGCKKVFNEDSFNNLHDKSLIDAVDIYFANAKILNDYNNSCLFSIPYSISMMYKDSDSFEEVYQLIEEKRQMVIGNAEYLTKAGLGNSAYSFSTGTFKSTIYNQTASWFDLTVNNYDLMVSILDDIADWYVLEYGGNYQ